MSLSLVILAAGLARRYGADKPFDAIGPGGATLMDYTVYDAVRAGVGRVVFVVRSELAPAWQAAATARYGGRASVVCAVQQLDDLPGGRAPPTARTRPWGTAPAVLAAAGQITGPFIVANADDFYGAASLARAAEFLRAPAVSQARSHALVGFALRDTLPASGGVSRAICTCAADGRLTGLAEQTGIERAGDDGRCRDACGGERRISGDAIVSMNLWAFRPSILDSLRAAFRAFLEQHGSSLERELYLPAVVDELVRSGRAAVCVLSTPDRWCGLTHPDDRRTATEFLAARVAEGAYPGKMWP